jgi:hypothetical protein
MECVFEQSRREGKGPSRQDLRPVGDIGIGGQGSPV